MNEMIVGMSFLSNLDLYRGMASENAFQGTYDLRFIAFTQECADTVDMSFTIQ